MGDVNRISTQRKCSHIILYNISIQLFIFVSFVIYLWRVQVFRYVFAYRSYSFVCTVHHLIIIIVQTYLKALKLYNIYVFCRVCEQDEAYSLRFPLYNKWGCIFFSLPISLVMIERIYILCLIIIIKSEVWTITHCLGLGHETMVSAVCLSIFLCFKNYLKHKIWIIAITLLLDRVQHCNENDDGKHCTNR